MNAIGIALVWCVVQVSLVGVLAAGLYVVVRRFRPATAAPVVLVALLMMVVLSFMAWSPWPRWTWRHGAASDDAVAEKSVGGEKATSDQGPQSPIASNDVGAGTAPSPRPSATRGGGVAPEKSIALPAEPSLPAAVWRALADEFSRETATFDDGWGWPAAVAVLFLVAALAGLAWLVLGVVAVRRQRQSSQPVTDREILELVDVLAAELSCTRPLDVRQSDDLVTAATIGWRRPTILLPPDWTAWSGDQRRAVLAHEIAHARNQDFLAVLCGQLALVLHFYHPLVHWLMTRLRLEQELAADAAAAALLGGQRQYLATIAELALRQSDRWLAWPARSFLPTRSTFLKRIAMLRDSKLNFRRVSPAVHAATIAAVLLCGLAVAGLRGPARQLQAAADQKNPTVAPPAVADSGEETAPVGENAKDSEPLEKLRYGWNDGESYVYCVSIIGDRGDDTETRSGNVTYTAKSTPYDEIRLTVSSDLKYTTTTFPPRHRFVSGPYVHFFSEIAGSKPATIRIDREGKIVQAAHAGPSPHPLGDLVGLVIEPLPQPAQASWTVENESNVAVVSSRRPFPPFPIRGYRDDSSAVEKTVYTVQDASDGWITIDKRYEMTSAATAGGKPRFEAHGEGRLKFDTARGVFASLDFDIRVTVRDANLSEETPLSVSYRLLSEEELAELAAEAERTKAEEEAARRQRARPLTEEDIQNVLADLASGDRQTILDREKMLAGKKPLEPNPEIAQALVAVMRSDTLDGACRSEAARALGEWSTEESVPALIKTVIADPWSPVRSGAIKALVKYAPQEAIAPIAQQLTDGMTRGDASAFLKAAGPAAEDAVLPLVETGDAWSRSEACAILQVIGTEKSIRVLEKALSDDNWMVNGKAREALAAVKLRMKLNQPPGR